MAAEERENLEEEVIVNPSMADVCKVLTEIRAITQKLVHDVESLKKNYKDLTDSLKASMFSKPS